MKRIPLLAWLIVLVMQSATPVCSHPAPYSYLDLSLSPDAINVTLTAHTLDLAHNLNIPPDALLDATVIHNKQDSIVSLMRERLILTADKQVLSFVLQNIEPLPERQALALHLRFATPLTLGKLEMRCELFPYDPQHQTFVNLYDADDLRQQTILNKDHTAFVYFTGTRPGTWAAAKTFFVSGAYRSFTRLDYILFLLGLLMLGGNLSHLLLMMTAFCVAQSATLTLAALNFVNPSTRVVTAAIALSIVYVGVDNLLVSATSRDMRTWIAFFFGLAHGFGMANVLREFNLPAETLGWSLFSFNLGAVLCQICLATAIASLLTILGRRQPTLHQRFIFIGSLTIILMGTYWFIRRVFLP